MELNILTDTDGAWKPKLAKEYACPNTQQTSKMTEKITRNNKGQLVTHGIVHAGFRGFRRFVARKKSQCKLISFCLVIPHDTIPSNVVRQCKKTTT